MNKTIAPEVSVPEQPIQKAPRTGGVRFAPSPTGLFHLGNLRTAVISHELARRLQLPWVVRFEDIDRPRVMPGAREAQLEDLAKLGLVSNTVLIQSAFASRHRQLFNEAVRVGQVYPCACSRREILEALASAPHGPQDPVYTGHCRNLPPDRTHTKDSIAWRFRHVDESGREDFIIARTGPTADHASFVPAYHWACAIDDFDGGYEYLVRCQDLAPAARLQRYLHSWLGTLADAHEAPRILHTSLVVDKAGHRLEKRTQGVTLSEVDFAPPVLAEKFRDSFDWARFSAGTDFTESPAEFPYTKLL